MKSDITAHKLQSKKYSISIVSAMLFLPVVCFGGDITSSVASGGTLTDTSSDTFYILDGQNKYNWLSVPQDITTNYTNGTLILGNNQESVGTHSFLFRTWGLYNYNVNLSAKKTYLTGTINTSKGTGVLNLNFTGSDSLKADSLTFNGNGDGTRVNFTSTNGGLDFKNSTFAIGGTLTMKAGTDITLSNTQMTSRGSTITLESTGDIDTSSSTLNFNSGGTITLKGNNIALGKSDITLNGENSFLVAEANNNFSIDGMDLKLVFNTFSTKDSGARIQGKTLNIKNSVITANRTEVNTPTSTIHLVGDDNLILDNTSITAYNGGNSLLIQSTNGSIEGKSTQITQNDGLYSNATRFEATKDITFDKNSLITIKTGAIGTDGAIDFIAGNNINIDTINIATSYGNANVNFSATNDLQIDNINLIANITFPSTNDSRVNFSGKNINIKEGTIRTGYASAAIMNVHYTFNATDSIDLGNTGIAIFNGTYDGGDTYGLGAGTLTFSGKTLKHTGVIAVGRDEDGWNFLDSGLVGGRIYLTGITDKAELGTIKMRRGWIVANKDLNIDTLIIRQAADGISTGGNNLGPQSRFLAQEDGKYTIKNLQLLDYDNTSISYLDFYNANGNDSFVKGSTLTITDAYLGNDSRLYAKNIATTNIQNLTLAQNAVGNFNRLNIINNGSIIMDVTSQIKIATSFDVDIKLESNTLDNYGKPILSIVNAGQNMSNINVQAGTVYRFIDTKDGITYHFEYLNGQSGQLKVDKESFNCDGSGKVGECDYIKNAIAIYEGSKVEPTTNADGTIDYTAGRVDLAKGLEEMGLRYEKVVNFSTIGIQFLSNSPDNPYDIGDIRYYIWQKGGKTNGDAYVREIAALYPGFYDETITQTHNGQKIYTNTQGEVCQSTSAKECEASGYTPHQVQTTNSSIFDWLNELSIKQNGITWTGTNILNYDFDFFKQTAIQLNNTLDQIASIERKNSASTSTRLAADVAKVQRLVKLSRNTDRDEGIQFADYIKSLAKTRYAKANNQASDYEASQSESLDSGFLYKYSNRHTFANNLWATGIGSASFVSNGYGMLYGVNIGYDRFLPFGDNAIVIGGLVAYGYGSYNADLIRNTSHNVNTGIYSRAFIKNNEIDFNVSYTLGLNNEDLITRQNIWLSNLGQKYNYNTHTINTNINWGYIFGKKKGLVFKPTIGMSYYYIAVGQIQGKDAYVDMANNINFTTRSPEAGKSVLALNLALETRQYLSKGSYWFVNVGAAKDVFISANNAQQVDFVTVSNINYTHGDDLNTFVNGTAGGEIALREQVFVNFALGGKVGLSYKDINITANLGGRYVF